MKLTYNQVSRTAFVQAFQKIANTPANQKVAYSIKKLADELNKARQKIEKEYFELEKTLEKSSDEDKKVAIEAFGERTFEVNRAPMFLHELASFQLSAIELDALECIYTEGNNAPVVPLHSEVT